MGPGGATVNDIERRRPWCLALALVCAAVVLSGCQGDRDGRSSPGVAGPGAATPSDPRALEIAEATLEAMGGREAWEQTRYLAWDYLGRRQYLWDKWDGRVKVRYDRGDDPVVVTWRIDDLEGRAWVAGDPVEDPGWVADIIRDAHTDWTATGS
jgi:hypothetical protein